MINPQIVRLFALTDKKFTSKSIKILYSLSIIRFKIKYHPEESVKRKEEQVAALKV